MKRNTVENMKNMYVELNTFPIVAWCPAGNENGRQQMAHSSVALDCRNFVSEFCFSICLYFSRILCMTILRSVLAAKTKRRQQESPVLPNWYESFIKFNFLHVLHHKNAQVKTSESIAQLTAQLTAAQTAQPDLISSSHRSGLRVATFHVQ